MSERFEITIEQGTADKQYWRDIWRYRELFYFLVWRDILVRYKQTVIGIAWSLVRPVLTMAVFSIVFGKIANLSSEGVPYPILVFTALLPWQLFAFGLTGTSNSLIGNANLLTKVYFPRLIIPASSIVVSLVDFLISFAVLIALMFWYRFIPSWEIVFLPLFLVMVMLTSFGFGIWFAALNVKYRDFIHIVPFIVQFGLYVSPVGFSSSIIPENWKLLYSLNPMVGIIEGFRWAVLGSSDLNWFSLMSSLIMIVLALYWGIRYFRKTEKTFADVI